MGMDKASAKRSQHNNTTYANVVGPAFARFGQTIATFERNISQHFWARHVATCWLLKIELERMPWHNIVARTWPNDYNIMQHPQMLQEKFDHAI